MAHMHVAAESDSYLFLLARVLNPPLCAPTCATCSHAGDLPRASIVRSQHKLLEVRTESAPARARPVGTVALQHIAGRMIPGSHKIAPRRRAHLRHSPHSSPDTPSATKTCSHRREDESHLPPFWPSPHRRHCRRRFEARGPPPPPSRRLVARSICCRHAIRFQAETRRVGRCGVRRVGRPGRMPRRVGRLRRRLSRRSGRLRRSRRAALGSSR